MDAAWAKAYRDLPPRSQAILQALAVLDVPSIPLAGASMVGETPPDHADGDPDDLAAAGWGSADEHHFTLAAEARSFVANLATSITADEAGGMLSQLALRISALLTGSGSGGNDDLSAARHREVLEKVRAVVPTVVQAAVRAGRPELGAELARTAWTTVLGNAGEGRDQSWRLELARCGEQAAIASKQPALLVDLLRHSATSAAGAADWPTAEQAWLRIAWLADERGDQRLFDEALPRLAEVYHRWGLHHRAMDVMLELVAAHDHDEDPTSLADALAQAAATMMRAGRPDAATTQLERADTLLTTLEDQRPDLVRLHASVLQTMGEANAAHGAINSARTLFHRALTMVVDIDPEAADQIRVRHAALPKP